MLKIMLVPLMTGNTMVIADYGYRGHVMLAREVEPFWSKKPKELTLVPINRGKDGSKTLLINDAKFGDNFEFVGHREIIIHKGNRLIDSRNCLMPGKVVSKSKWSPFVDEKDFILGSSGTSMLNLFTYEYAKAFRKNKLFIETIEYIPYSGSLDNIWEVNNGGK